MSSVVAIGVDTEQTGRFKLLNLKKDREFLEKIFTKDELSYCFSKNDPSQTLAARFCAKEATVKAIGSLGFDFLDLNKVEVLINKRGCPILKILDAKYSKLKFLVSLSHSRVQAIAFVVIIG